MGSKTGLVMIVALLLTLSGCLASQHAADVQKGLEGDRITVGTVQREIRQGMSSAEVAEVLGSPNIVSTDEQGREVWIYDRVSTDSVYSKSDGGILALILGSSGLAGGATSYRTGAESTSQRTLTIIIKYDEEGRVDGFSYHSSRF